MTRRNTVGILLGIELMLNAVNINFVAFSRFHGHDTGMVFTLFAICITVAEVALGLAIVILLFRMRRTATRRSCRLVEGMTSNPVTLALTALLLPAASFLIIGVAAAAAPIGTAGCVRSRSPACSARSFQPSSPSGPHTGSVAEPLRAVVVVAARRTGNVRDRRRDRRSAERDDARPRDARRAPRAGLFDSYLSGEPSPALGRYYALQSLFAFSMMGVVLAPNLLQLFVCWELVGVCSYLLIGFWYTKPEAARAALKAFWTTKAGDVGLLIGIVLLHRATGTFDLGELRQLAAVHRSRLAGLSRHHVLHLSRRRRQVGAVPAARLAARRDGRADAGVGPDPCGDDGDGGCVSADAHRVVCSRSRRTCWRSSRGSARFTALLAAVLACVQTDIKRVLAYSTVSQLGYMMAAIGAGFAGAGFLHLLTHGVFKALLFLGAGAVIHAVHSNDINDMGGLARKMPQTAIVFLIGTLSLAGVPLFAGFASKEEVLGAVWTGGFHVPFFMLLFGGVPDRVLHVPRRFSRLLRKPECRKLSAGRRAAHAHDAPPAMTGRCGPWRCWR